MRLSRKRFAAGAAGALASVGILRYPGEAAQFDYRLSTEQPADHHMTVQLQEAVKKIREGSNGQLNITVYPASQLGGQTQMMAQLRAGSVQLITSGDFILANIVPLAGITTTPFAFANPAQALATMAGPLGKYRRDAIGKIGLYAFAQSWDEGFRQVSTSRKPIHTLEDLRGLKIRVPDAPVIIATFRALGASPVSITAGEMYMALQTHLADGMENPLGGIESFKIYEVQKYLGYTNHIWTAYTILANAAARDALPQTLRDLLDQHIDGAGVADNTYMVKWQTTLEATLKSQGMTFNTVDTEPLREAVRASGLYTKLRDQYGPEAWGMLEKATGKKLA